MEITGYLGSRLPTGEIANVSEEKFKTHELGRNEKIGRMVRGLGGYKTRHPPPNNALRKTLYY